MGVVILTDPLRQGRLPPRGKLRPSLTGTTKISEGLVGIDHIRTTEIVNHGGNATISILSDGNLEVGAEIAIVGANIAREGILSNIAGIAATVGIAFRERGDLDGLVVQAAEASLAK